MSDRVSIDVGPTGEAQRTDFQNAMLQSCGDGAVDFSIATYVRIPGALGSSVKLAAAYLYALLTDIAEAHPEISFEAQIGPGEHGGEPNG